MAITANIVHLKNFRSLWMDKSFVEQMAWLMLLW